MRTIIAGSRSIKDYDVVFEAIRSSGIDITEVVSGRAKGVDTLGEEFARNHGIKVVPYPADWKNLKVANAKAKQGKYGLYNVNAGRDRNRRMAEYSDALIAVIHNNSAGTAHMIRTAEEHGLVIHVCEV